MVKLKSSAKAQTKIKKFNYVNPLLSAINNSKNSNSYQFQAAKQKIFSLFRFIITTNLYQYAAVI